MYVYPLLSCLLGSLRFGDLAMAYLGQKVDLAVPSEQFPVFPWSWPQTRPGVASQSRRACSISSPVVCVCQRGYCFLLTHRFTEAASPSFQCRKAQVVSLLHPPVETQSSPDNDSKATLATGQEPEHSSQQTGSNWKQIPLLHAGVQRVEVDSKLLEALRSWVRVNIILAAAYKFTSCTFNGWFVSEFPEQDKLSC